MKQKIALFFAGIVVLSSMNGCSVRSDFTAISGKNVNLSNIQLDKKLSKGKATGEDCRHTFLFIPTSGAPTLDEALDRALESKNSNLLVDAKVKFHWFFIPLIYTQECWNAEGTAYETYK